MKSPTRLFDLLEHYSERDSTQKEVFWYKSAGVWNAYSAEEYVEYSRLISLGFLSMGIGKDTRIGTIMVNCPEWNFFDMGIMQTRAVHVPIYPTISEENYRYILKDSGIQYIIVSNLEIYQLISHIIKDNPSIRGIFSIEILPGIRHCKEILELGRNHPHPDELDMIKDSIQPDELVTIIYTSGTTGKPKGVMLSHKNFVTNYMALAKIFLLEPEFRALSFLPLCHVFERTTGYVYQSYGLTIYYVTDIDKLAEYIREIKPDLFATVPRVLEKIYNRIVMKGRSLRIIPKIIFFWALRQGHKFGMDHRNGSFYNIKLFIANRLIFSRWRKALGGSIRLIVCGGASLHPRLTRIFWAARLPVYEAYGLTETSPGISSNHPGRDGVSFGTVGPVLSGVEVKIAGDGEILVKGPNVMLGYYNRPEKTLEVLDEEGWFHTGDIGILDQGRFLKITDRKKEIF